MSKRILLIADAGGFWTKRFIQHVLLPDGWEVVLFPIWRGPGVYEAYYQEHHVTVYRDAHTLPVVSHVPRARMWARIALNARDLRRLGPFDAIQNQYLSQRDLALGMALKRAYPNARWVCSFMGSDLLRSSVLEIRRMRPYLRRCDRLTLHPNKLDDLRRVFGEAIARKATAIDFGQATCQYIDEIRDHPGRAGCKALYGIDASKAVLCVGGSAASEQRHIDIIRALRALPESLRARLALVFSMTYGERSPGYIDSVRREAETLGCQTVFLTAFMEEEEAARLRVAADAFVLALPTDFFSTTMKEYLYAGAHVLLGEWLHYPRLDELGVEVSYFSDLDELPGLMERLFAGTLPPVDMEKRHPVGRDSSWTVVAPEWRKLYGT